MKWFTAAVLVILLAGCGQKGKLYQPTTAASELATNNQ